MRCDVSCGCSKSKNNRVNRAKSTIKKITAKKLAITSSRRKDKNKRRAIVQNKIKFCKACPQSSPTPDERRRKARVCHKTKISLQAIFNNPKFKCPINNF